jgi:hypothetical protein
MHTIPEPIAVEARAKIIWGESPEKVRDYLMSKNVGEKDAAVLLEEVMAERAASIRSDGMKKIWLGSAFVAAPIIYYFVTHLWVGYWSLKLFAGLVVLAAVGIAKLTTGISLVLKPRAVRGDLANSTDV